MTTPRAIAIIGAGLAGLSCAQALKAQGHQVHLFEKSRGVGGRMSTRVFETWACDHGAQYFTATDPTFKQQIERWQAAGACQVWDARITSFDADGWQEIKPSAGRFVGTPSMTAPAKQLAKEQDIQFSTTIDQLERHTHGWTLHCKETGPIEQIFDTVLLAIPSKQAQALVLKHSSSMHQFCQDAVMVPNWTLMVYASAPLPLSFDAAFINQGLFAWLARSSSKPGRQSGEAWAAQATSEWSAAHESLTKEQAGPLLAAGFESLTGYRPEQFQCHLWRFARLAQPHSSGIRFDPTLRLGVCGDWTTNEKVEGAWLSGQALARTINTVTVA